jgi:hypothetical protein
MKLKLVLFPHPGLAVAVTVVTIGPAWQKSMEKIQLNTEV